MIIRAATEMHLKFGKDRFSAPDSVSRQLWRVKFSGQDFPRSNEIILRSEPSAHLCFSISD